MDIVQIKNVPLKKSYTLLKTQYLFKQSNFPSFYLESADQCMA